MEIIKYLGYPAADYIDIRRTDKNIGEIRVWKLCNSAKRPCNMDQQNPEIQGG